jgi:oxygen-independent coproporphyrinogen-3 oxidase
MTTPSPNLSTLESVDIQLFGERFELTAAHLEKYSTHGPRYTSYPTAPMWRNEFGADAFAQAIRATNQGPDALQVPLSLYVHLPFCESRCLFCGCNVVITRQHDQAEKYLGYLFKDIDRTAALMNTQRPVVQFHWGGGTPTYLSVEQMERLFRFQAERFNLQPDAEIAIEVDPRVTTDDQLVLLSELGFNRISLGLQDVDPKVQEAIHRIQPREMTEAMVNRCRELGMTSLNLDLIYGLPFQTAASFEHTLDAVIEMSPDRIALYNYAHVPWMAPHQNQIPEVALPSGSEKIRIFMRAIQRLTEAGYLYIGMDHFAKPQDELATAQQTGGLRRNFMGYTTKAGSELYAFGVSGISGLNAFYAQNWRKLSEYYEAVDAGHLPTMRGYALSQDDQLRRGVITQILCHGELDFRKVEAEFGLPSFETYFAVALAKLADPAQDRLLTMSAEGLKLTPLGRILSRNVAMVFDAYLEKPAAEAQPDKPRPIYSKTI